MKIAAVTEDSITISQHFGRAPMYLVVTVEDGRIVSRETRDKLGHAQFSGEGTDRRPCPATHYLGKRPTDEMTDARPARRPLLAGELTAVRDASA